MKLRPKVILRFSLKNIRNNLKQSWTQLLEEETLEDLFDGVYGNSGNTKNICMVKIGMKS